jgi:hypothetical protein
VILAAERELQTIRILLSTIRPCLTPIAAERFEVACEVIGAGLAVHRQAAGLPAKAVA